MQPLTRCTLSPAAPLVQPPPVRFPWRSTAACAPPHGGIFVFPVVTNAPMYCVALAVGSILGGLILSLLKKNLPQEQSSES